MQTGVRVFSRHELAAAFAFLVRVAGFILAALYWGWEPDGSCIAVGFQCIFTFALIFGIAILALISERLFDRVLKLPAFSQILLFACILLGAGFAYEKFAYFDRGILEFDDVAIAIALSDVVLPGMAYYLALIVQKGRVK